jgi:thioredoxin-dependent peroxiredoxin
VEDPASIHTIFEENTMSHRIAKAAALAAAVVVVAGVSALAEELKAGDKAPPFSLQGTDGKTYSLDQFKGKKGVVIAWFPKAATKGCTIECKSLREHSAALKPLGVAYFTASVDTPEDNKKFADDLGLDYPILSDPTKSVAEAYGVMNPTRKVAQRWTFYIDKDGVIKAVDKKINVATAGPDVAAKVKALGMSSN